MKRLEISRPRYYLGVPLKRAGKRARRYAGKAAAIARRITGRWWCFGCRAYHSGRVVAFWPDGGLSDGCCSIHLTTPQMKRCETITIGGLYGEDITERVKKGITGGAEVARDQKGETGC